MGETSLCPKKLSNSQLEKASGFAENVDSFHAYIAGVYNILNL